MGTHDVGTQGAEGRGATGQQVAAVEWQEDLDVVLTVSLWGKRDCQVHICHQRALQRPSALMGGQAWGSGGNRTLGKTGVDWQCPFPVVKGTPEWGIPPLSSPWLS